MVMNKKRYLQELQRDEAFHAMAYSKLASQNCNAKYKDTLEVLYSMETRHSQILEDLLKNEGMDKLPEDRYFERALIRLSIKILGITFTIRFMEHNKLITHKKLMKAYSKYRFTTNEKEVLRIMSKEEQMEDKLNSSLLKSNFVLKNIKDIIFGMNDGLVEVLAATVGFAEALQVPSIILIASLLVAFSGAFSMAGSAYLATKYEDIAQSKKGKSLPLKSALYTGIFYFCGAIIPILPFVFNMQGLLAIALAVLMTAGIVIITSSIIAVLSNESVAKRIVEALVISMGAAFIAMLIGYYAHVLLHISI
jgi:VIT1/CCC1 family predicted Fe2+/Mn2+ transporter